ncbi:MAG: zinc ribbon domain-containing protein [Firmicutes bacterium]|nr:zinc ribbon domain-containing protein [Bacillota bacterium]
MPDYEFTCKKCGHQFTVNVPWQRKGEVTCPSCGSSELREKFSLWGWSRGGTSDAGACSPRFG